MLLKKEKKEIVFSTLKALLQDYGYQWILTGGAPKFYKKGDEYIPYFWLNFFDSGAITFSRMEMTVIEVEDILFKTGVFDWVLQDLEKSKKLKMFSSTVTDSRTELIPISINGDDFETKEQVEEYTEKIVDYIINYGFPFIEYFCYLPNVLTEMERLQAEGRDWNEILSGRGDRLFRGLIISKLCNDQNYSYKELHVDNIFSTESVFKKWLPYYEKLKERLKTLEPIYNV
jgi:hypothetical protein